MSDVHLHVYSTGPVRPGDTLVFTTCEVISAARAAEIKAKIRELLPDVEAVIASGMSSCHVVKSEVSA